MHYSRATRGYVRAAIKPDMAVVLGCNDSLSNSLQCYNNESCDVQTSSWHYLLRLIKGTLNTIVLSAPLGL